MKVDSDLMWICKMNICWQMNRQADIYLLKDIDIWQEMLQSKFSLVLIISFIWRMLYNETEGGSLMPTTVMVKHMIRHVFSKSPSNHMVCHGGLVSKFIIWLLVLLNSSAKWQWRNCIVWVSDRWRSKLTWNSGQSGRNGHQRVSSNTCEAL